MMIVTEPHLHVPPAALAGRERDTLQLSWEERRWTRKRVRTTRGREVALALPTGSILRPGDVIAVEADWYLAVEGRPEPVLAVFPRNREEAIRIAFDVGNRHFPLALRTEGFLVPDDTAMEQLLARLGVPWERCQAVFDPLGGRGHRHGTATNPADGHAPERPGTAPDAPARLAGERSRMIQASARLLSLLHFADSAFPAGGFAHSFGLEALCQSGVVADAAGVARFLESQLEGSAGPCDATAAVAAGRAFAGGDLAACRRLDATLEAMKSVREFREGSRQMGRQTLRVAAALTADPALGGYRAEVDAGCAPGHHAVAFGMVAGALGWGAEETAAAFLYSTTALLVGAALRLLPLGQTEGQRLLWGLHPVIERLAREAAGRDPSGLWSFAPGIELAGLRHEGLEMRLFRS